MPATPSDVRCSTAMTYASRPAPQTRNAPRGIRGAVRAEVTVTRALSCAAAPGAADRSADALDDVTARRLARQVGVALVLEAQRGRLQLVEQPGQLLTGLLALGAQALAVPDLPGTQDRGQHLVLVDAQVVDARHGDLHRPAAEVLDGVAGHLEGRHDVPDGLQRLV